MILFIERGGITSHNLFFVLTSVFCWNYFSHQKNNAIAHLLISPEIDNHTPPQVNQELTCCYNHEGYEGERVDEDEDWGRFRHE